MWALETARRVQILALLHSILEMAWHRVSVGWHRVSAQQVLATPTASVFMLSSPDASSIRIQTLGWQEAILF